MPSLEDWITRICDADINGDRTVKAAIAREAPADLSDQLLQATDIRHSEWAAASLATWKQGALKEPEPPPISARDLKIQTAKGQRVTIEGESRKPGKAPKIVSVEGDRVTLDDGREFSIDQIALPLSIDRRLKDLLENLQSLADDWANAAIAPDRKISPENAWPMVVVWDGLPPVERDLLRGNLTNEQLTYWKQAKGLWLRSRAAA